MERLTLRPVETKRETDTVSETVITTATTTILSFLLTDSFEPIYRSHLIS